MRDPDWRPPLVQDNRGRWSKPRSSWRERLWSKVAIAGPADCWIWTSNLANNGCPYLSIDGTPWKASRLSFFLANGYFPPVVRHTCDNPPCVNPAHLLPGTQADNMRDMYERGRSYERPKIGAVCSKGHEMTPENTYLLSSTGMRRCKKCSAERSRRYYLRKAEQTGRQA